MLPLVLIALFAVGSLRAKADPPHKAASSDVSSMEFQSYVNRGTVQAVAGFTIAAAIASYIRKDSRKRRRKDYSWDLSYQPDKVLIQECVLEGLYDERVAAEMERRSIAHDQAWIFTALSAKTHYRVPSLALAASLTVAIAGIPMGIQTYRFNSAMDAGRIQMAAGNLGGAEFEFRRAIAMDSSATTAKVALADVMYRGKRLNELVPVLLDVCNAPRPDSKSLVMLGDCFMALHRDEDAEEKYRQAIAGARIDTFSDAELKLSRCLLRIRRVEDAVRELRMLARGDPKNVRAHAELGKALLGIGFTEEGMEHLEQSAALEPNNVIGLRALADGYVNQQRYADAADMLRAALSVDPEYAEDYYNLGYVLKRMNDTKGAMSAYEKYVAIRTHHYQPVKPTLAKSEQPSEESTDPAAPTSGQSAEVHIRTAMAQLQSLQYTRRISMNQ
jgi:tetratricopeptide (TPR) repeat protein